MHATKGLTDLAKQFWLKVNKYHYDGNGLVG